MPIGGLLKLYTVPKLVKGWAQSVIGLDLKMKKLEFD